MLRVAKPRGAAPQLERGGGAGSGGLCGPLPSPRAPPASSQGESFGVPLQLARGPEVRGLRPRVRRDLARRRRHGPAREELCLGLAAADGVVRWLEREGLLSLRGAMTKTGQVVIVGSANFSESQTVAELYTQALGAMGYPTEQARSIGNRDTYFPRLERGHFEHRPRLGMRGSIVAVGSMADQILAEIDNGLAHQRHKWAAQCQAHGLSMTHFHVLAILEADGPTPTVVPLAAAAPPVLP